jgi:hypothetical protein
MVLTLIIAQTPFNWLFCIRRRQHDFVPVYIRPGGRLAREMNINAKIIRMMQSPASAPVLTVWIAAVIVATEKRAARMLIIMP